MLFQPMDKKINRFSLVFFICLLVRVGATIKFFITFFLTLKILKKPVFCINAAKDFFFNIDNNLSK